MLHMNVTQLKHSLKWMNNHHKGKLFLCSTCFKFAFDLSEPDLI